MVTKAELSKGTGLAVQTLFEVLVLHLSTSDKKNLDFSKVFSALGVAFDLHKQVDNSFSIRNTEQRVKELVERIDAEFRMLSDIWSNFRVGHERPWKVRDGATPAQVEW